MHSNRFMHNLLKLYALNAVLLLQLGKKHIGRGFEPPMKRSFMFRFGGSMNWSTCIVWAIVFLTQRDQCFFIYSAFPDAWKTNVVLILMTAFEVLFSTQWLISCYVVFFAQYQYLISSKFWLQKIWYRSQILRILDF